MTLYNCKSEDDYYRITKFDRDMNVEASYLTSTSECDCPAGQRDTCRHRKMLQAFLKKKATRGQWFYNYDMMSWHPAETDTAEDEPDTETVENAPQSPWAEHGTDHAALAALASIPGITMIQLASADDIIHAHNVIADAVGEPEAKITVFDKAKKPFTHDDEPRPTPIVTRRL